MIYHFESLSSTNDEAQGERYGHGDIIVAEHQSAGRGQRGNRWLSGEGLNLTLSVVLCPKEIEVRRQFLILQSSALAICDTLREVGLEPKIKWTNDIYIGDRKIVGILIENRLSGDMLSRSIVGVGLNVNQIEFDPELPNPTSMALEMGRQFDRVELLSRLSKAFEERMAQLHSGGEQQIREDYHSLIYRLGELHPYRLGSGEVLWGRIVGVESSGELLVEWESGERGGYLFGSIDFMIESRKR
ncbi:MAG: biotin--[acetyl-CoA-carboxylase] ligase [Rikenellaceae bacterium]